MNWSVNGVPGGNSTVGTIAISTLAGVLAAYTAPDDRRAGWRDCQHRGDIRWRGQRGLRLQATVNIVANQNSTLSGQSAFQVRGFQANGFPFGMVGRFKADGLGGLSNIFVDTNNVQSDGSGSVFTSKVMWNGSYSMDTD